MKSKFDINSFVNNFKKIIRDTFGVDAMEANIEKPYMPFTVSGKR